MKAFLLSLVLVIGLGIASYAILEGGLAQSSGDAFTAASARIDADMRPDPRGYLSHVHDRAGTD